MVFISAAMAKNKKGELVKGVKEITDVKGKTRYIITKEEKQKMTEKQNKINDKKEQKKALKGEDKNKNVKVKEKKETKNKDNVNKKEKNKDKINNDLIEVV